MNRAYQAANILYALTLALPVLHQALVHIIGFVADTAKEVRERFEAGLNG